MPKKSNNKPFWGRGGRGGNSDEKHYFGHDDRIRGPGNNGPKNNRDQRRVSFKRNYTNPLTAHTNSRAALMKRQLDMIRDRTDEDVLMTAGSQNNNRQMVNRGRGKGFQRGRNSPLPRGGQQRQVGISQTNWYKIFIPHGQKYTKEFILGNLQSCTAPYTFTPIMYKVIGGDAAFFVEDHRTAMKLSDCDKRITTADGFKINVRVRPSKPPPIEICDALKERLKQAMEKRYVPEANALNLSKFYQDPDLAGDYWCPLARPEMLMVVLGIVEEYIPNLEALNLDSNKIYNIEKLGSLASKFEKLKILHIGDNKVKEISYLNGLKTKNLQLEELRLEGNPVCNKYKERWNDYVNDIRKIFPKLMKLDGKELPPPILFDVEDQKTELPPLQRMFIYQSNTTAQEVASQFLQQYFIIFDAENRQPLLGAYHEHALFSMTLHNIAQSSNNAQYLFENRNLFSVLESNRKHKLLKQGRLPVVAFISEMPRTKHDLASFTMDLGLVTERMMVITVTGLFKELNGKDNKELIRFFNRTFTISPEGAGFCIISDQLIIINPTSEQEKQFDSAMLITQPTPEPSTVPETTTDPGTLGEDIKQQMTLALSQTTNMNIEWSLKCLEDLQWNFDDAYAAFQKAFSSGKIPPTAFTN